MRNHECPIAACSLEAEGSEEKKQRKSILAHPTANLSDAEARARELGVDTWEREKEKEKEKKKPCEKSNQQVIRINCY